MASCTICRLPPVGLYVLSLYGEATCASHPALDRCFFCARPRSRVCAGWSRFTADRVRCPTCSRRAVDTQEQARAYIPDVRREMAGIGISLCTPVRVGLCDADLIDKAGGSDGSGVCLGLTHSRAWLDGRADEVLHIEIARGLPETHFGQVLAHEIGHAWLVQNRATDLDPALAEGVCELFSGAWLKRNATAVASALRESLAANPDPVYGDGYRMVRAAVVRFGVDAVLKHICTHGTLP